jgi:putative transcriptional regulator
MDDEGLHNSIKVQRAIRDLTQADLAAMAGVTRKSVNAVETGRMVPSVVLALKLARALGVGVDTLFTLNGAAETVGPHSDQEGTSNEISDPKAVDAQLTVQGAADGSVQSAVLHQRTSRGRSSDGRT